MTKHSSYKKQNGAVLIVSLIILLILTVLGVSVMQTTTLEEKMAAATRDKDIAFQAAEAAIREAEKWLTTNAPASTGFSDTCVSGLCTVSTSGIPRWKDASICSGLVWEGACSVEVTGVTGVSKSPRYIVEFLSRSAGAGENIMAANLGDFPSETFATYYRITAVGYGGSEDAQVLLQSTYGI